jgi:hypothetical protein
MATTARTRKIDRIEKEYVELHGSVYEEPLKSELDHFPPISTLRPIVLRAPFMNECWAPTLMITLDSEL